MGAVQGGKGVRGGGVHTALWEDEAGRVSAAVSHEGWAVQAGLLRDGPCQQASGH